MRIQANQRLTKAKMPLTAAEIGATSLIKIYEAFEETSKIASSDRPDLRASQLIA